MSVPFVRGWRGLALALCAAVMMLSPSSGFVSIIRDACRARALRRSIPVCRGRGFLLWFQPFPLRGNPWQR